jgi:hypothetical protein
LKKPDNKWHNDGGSRECPETVGNPFDEGQHGDFDGMMGPLLSGMHFTEKRVNFADFCRKFWG